MRCNWRRWLWGAIPLLLLSFIAVAVEHERLESDLAQRAAMGLSQAGLGWAAVDFSGRDALLTGLAPQESEPGKAAALLAGLWGVRRVENRAGLIEKAERYLWWASRRNGRIRLSGYVPSSDARQAILGVTRASFPGLEVVDRMVLTRGVPEIEDWLGGISFALKQLASLRRGDVRLDDLGLSVAGEAEDGATYRVMKAALRGNLPKDIKLVGEQVTPPVVAPYTWAAKLSDGELVLTGYVPSETDRAGLLAVVRASAPDAQLDDRMQPGDGAPQGWAVAAMASLRELPHLQDAHAKLSDAALIVSGMASDAATAAAIRDRLRVAVPASIAFHDEISARPPPVGTSPPALEVQRSAAPPSAASGAGQRDGEPAAPPGEEANPSASGAPPAGEGSPSASGAPSAGETRPSASGAMPAGETIAGHADTSPSGKASEGESATPPAAEATKSASSLPAAAASTSAATPPAADVAGHPKAGDAVAAPNPTEPRLPEPPRVISSGDARTQECADALAAAAGSGSILFRVGSAELEARSFATLDRLARAAQSCPGVLIEVGGHASAEGGAAVNQRLSLRRAQSVAAYLARAGVDRQQLESTGFGASRPIVPNDSSEHMAMNRRIEFTVHPK